MLRGTHFFTSSLDFSIWRAWLAVPTGVVADGGEAAPPPHRPLYARQTAALVLANLLFLPRGIMADDYALSGPPW